MVPHDDIVNELLDDDALDPKKLFDESEYSTLIIDRAGFSKKENETANLLEQLLDPEITRDQSEEIFSKLKDSKAQKLLVDAITVAEDPREKVALAAACWECGLDFSADFLFFVELACSEDFKLAMEALTVVEYTEESIDEAVLKSALEIAQKSKSSNTVLVEDLIANINDRLN